MFFYNLEIKKTDLQHNDLYKIGEINQCETEDGIQGHLIFLASGEQKFRMVR